MTLFVKLQHKYYIYYKYVQGSYEDSTIGLGNYIIHRFLCATNHMDLKLAVLLINTDAEYHTEI